MIGHETLRPRVPLGIRNAGPVIRCDVEVVVLRPARRRKIGVAHPAVAADGHGVRPRKPLLRCGPRHPAETASQLVGQSLRHRVGQRQPAEQRMNAQRLPCARQCNCTVEHLFGVHVAGQRLEFGQQPLHFSQQPGPVRRNPPEGNARLDEGERAEFARRQLIQSILDKPFLRWRTLKCNTACQGSARPVALERRIWNVHEVERRTQAEFSMVAGHQAHALATLTAQCDSRHGATAFDRHCVCVGELGHQALRMCRCWRTSSTRTR